MENYYISIITPSYNSSSYIEETIKSVVYQTYKNWELIIVDDSSIDNTVNIVNKYVAVDKRVKLIQNSKNYGAAFSRNIGLKESKYDYIAFLDSDDLWLEDKLKNQISFMKENNISFCFTGYEIINSIGKSLGKTVDTKQTGSFSYNDMLKKKATLGCSTVMINKKHFDGLLKIPSLRTGQDYAFWLKLLKKPKIRAYVLPKVLTQYRITPNSISRNKFKKVRRQWQIYRQIENLNFFESVYFFSFYAFRAVFRVS